MEVTAVIASTMPPNHGLSIEEYTSILVVAQNDPVVREKILQRIRSSPK